MRRLPVLLCAGLLTGLCQAAELRVTVAEYSSKTGPYFEAAAEAFEAAHPEHEVSIEVVPWDVLLQKLTTDIAGNANADLAIIGTRWLVDFVEQGIVTSLDDYMTDEFRERFIPTFLTPSVLNGQTYGLPIAASARAMYYNEDLLAEAGLDAPPATWEELLTAARAISELGEDIHGYGLQGKEIETDVYFYYPMWSFGGAILAEDGSSGLDTEAALSAAELYRQMISEGLTQPGVTAYNREDVQNLFKEGRVGMMITAPFLAAQIQEEAPDLNYGIAPIPEGTTRATYGVTDSIVMFENSEAKDLAWQFLDFIFQQEWRSRFTREEGFLPVHAAVAEEPFFTENEDLATFAAILPDARFAPTIAGWEEIADITISALQRIYLEQAEPEAALAEAAAQVDRVVNP